MSDAQNKALSNIICISSDNFKTKKNSNNSGGGGGSSGSSSKGKSKGGNNFKGKKTENNQKKPRPVRERAQRVYKKLYRIEVRKLPATNYDMDDFKQSIVAVSEKLSLPSDDFIVEHFITGTSIYVYD
jgi:hypothetical protein